jgi:oligopeptide/dipeptide ABC transporter ATP-binding protein
MSAPRDTDIVVDVGELTVDFATPRGVLRAVDRASWTVHAGEILAIVGESGSGKSVSQQVLFDLVPSPPATIRASHLRFAGRELSSLSARERRALRGKEMALVFQDPQSALNPLLTVERQLTEVLETHEHVTHTAARARSLAALIDVGIADPERRLDAYPHELSGGMRQRVVIAMALLCNPKLVVADEPTTALDVTLQAQVLALFRALVQRRGSALVLVTHSFGVVAACADRVQVMYAGRIVERGTVRDVLARPAHPYTRALLASLPELDGPADAALVPIPGAPPDLTRLPAGCAFEPRCAWRVERCARERPELETVGASESACWRAREVAAGGTP